MMDTTLFWKTARERERVRVSRLQGLAPPWTTDPAISQYRFCNVRREDDRTTAWFRENVRMRHPDDLTRTLFNTIVFRWFNRIETAEILLRCGLFDEWNPLRAEVVLGNSSPVVTGAYVIKTPNGMNKLRGVLWCVENIRPYVRDLARWMNESCLIDGLREACTALMRFDYLGGFMAHQLVADLKYTPVLHGCMDRFTWAYPGPGTARGVSRLLGRSPDWLNPNNATQRYEILIILRELQRQSTTEWAGEPLEMSDISNWCCEYDKWCRVIQDGARMKQRYTPGRKK